MKRLKGIASRFLMGGRSYQLAYHLNSTIDPNAPKANLITRLGETVIGGYDIDCTVVVGEDVYGGSFPVSTESIPFGDIPALQAAGWIPDYQNHGQTVSLDTDINWEGQGGERSEIGLVPNDHAAFIAGANIDLQQFLNVADAPADSSNLSYGHMPNIHWVPFLMTGDSKWIAYMEDNYDKVLAKTGRAPDQFMGTWQENGRYLAWPLRLLGQLARLQQLGLTTNTHYVDALNNFKNYLTTERLQSSETYYDNWRVLNFNAVTHESFGWTSWMESMVGQVVNYLVQLGHTDWLPIAEWNFEHLKRRLDAWGLKGVDNDHVFFYRYDNSISNYTEARAFASSNTFYTLTPYLEPKQSYPTYANWPSDQLFYADQQVDGAWYTYANRAQYAYQWAALAAKNGISGADVVADTLYDGIQQRGDTWDYKNSIGGYPYSPQVPVNYEWTPVRDSNDVVTSSSWASIPVSTETDARFVKVKDWDMVAGITSDLVANGFDPQTMAWGNGKVGSTLKAWTGLAYDPVSKKSYHARGGGHADSSINGIWEHDFRKLRYSIVDMPTDPNDPIDQWPIEYITINGTFTSGIDFNDVVDFSVTPKAITSYTTYMDSTGRFHEQMPSDGRPASMHYYNGIGKLGDWIWTTRNRKFSYNLVTGESKTEHWTKDGQSFIPDINNDLIYHAGSDTYYGCFASANSSFDFSKLSSNDPLDIKAVGLPAGMATTSESVILKKDEDNLILFKPSTNTTGAAVAEFNMSTETWGPKRDLVNQTNSDRPWYVQEMIPAIFIPNWGNQGSILFHYTWSGTGDDGEPLAKDWWILDYETLQPSRFGAINGYPGEHGEHTGNKFFIDEIDGMTFAFYMWVRDEQSDLYIMRLQ